MLGQNAYNASGSYRPTWNSGTSYVNGQSGGSYQPGGSTYNPIIKTLGYAGGSTGQIGAVPKFSGNKQEQQLALNNYVLGNTQANAPQGFQYAGAPIAGQMFSNTTVGGLPSQTTTSKMRYNPYNFWAPETNFAERNPYQYSEIQGFQAPEINVGDLFSPNMGLARREIEDQRNKTYEQMLSSLNGRGMLTTGAVDKANYLANTEFDRNLADSADRFAIAQTQAQMQEDQMRRAMQMQEDQTRRAMEYQRQVQQAEEIFRQQGASDEQARYLAEQSINLQGMQAGQNLQGFQTNLGAQQQQYEQALARAQTLMAQQNQQFQQTLAGRQQATAEEQLANLIRRQPLEDLMKMWMQQAGPTGPTEGSAGAMGILAPLMGMGMSFI